NPNRIAPDAREATNERLSVERFELVEEAGIHDPRDDLADVVAFSRIAWNNVVELGGIMMRILGLGRLHGLTAGRRDRTEHIAHDADRIGIVLRVVIRDSGDPAMDVRAAEFLRGHFFAGGGLHEWRSPEKDRSLIANNDGFIAHGGNVSSACGAGA